MDSLKTFILPLLMLLNINYLFPSINLISLLQLMLICIVAYFHWKKSKILFELNGCNIIIIISIIAAIKGFTSDSISLTELLLTVCVLIALAVIAGSIAVAENTEDKITLYFSVSISIYVATCVLMYMIGIRPETDVYSFDNASRMGALLGITQRIYFPFTQGINSFGSVVGLSIVSTVACISFAVNHRKLLVLLLLFSIFAIIGVDSRGPLFYSIAAFPIGYLAFNSFRLFAYLSILLLSMLFLVILNANLFIEYAKEVIDILSGRPLIWFAAINNLSEFNFNHFVGFGMYGQVISEIGYDYAVLFAGYDTDAPEKMSLHNFALQSIFDIGIVGYLVIMVISFQSLYRFSKCKCNSCKIYSFVIVYLLLCGLTEPVPTVYSLSTFLVFLVAVSFSHNTQVVDV